jgi:hypothetical protein
VINADTILATSMINYIFNVRFWLVKQSLLFFSLEESVFAGTGDRKKIKILDSKTLT